MGKQGLVMLYYFLSVLALFVSLPYAAADEDRVVHIVYMGSLPDGEYFPAADHLTVLQDVVQDSMEENVLVRSYQRSFNGFAAKITDAERQKLAAMEGVVSVFPSRIYQLQTTRSWGFMSFNKTTERLHDRRKESELIVGFIDTGIWPESESFNDKGFSPSPKKWKGECKGGKNFTCNNKIIGARYYTSEIATMDSVRDTVGHGSHTASTAAGIKVNNASFYGLAQGVATGGVPFARIAAYKVCDIRGCSSEALLAAFDDAIADGVDVISISIGRPDATDFTEDPIAIGAFHAMAKGILTVNSAGNSGPDSGSVASVSPWMLSVAASTIDRSFIDKVVLGNGTTLVGKSVNTFSLYGKKYPLVHGKDIASKGCDEGSAIMCFEGCVDSDLIKGKIVLCDSMLGATVVHGARGVGSILQNPSSENISSLFSLPISALMPGDYNIVKEYLQKTNKPEGEILKSEIREDLNAPVVAEFSSRGPNNIVPDILKPDLTAPGVNILAAFSPLASPSNNYNLDNRQVNFSVLSGTSMACPHASAVAAYVKTFHPDWSPSAIKSALMTTAWKMTPSKNADAEFAYGSGHINPLRAADPGLIYEAGKEDYIKILCGLGYSSSRIKQISGDNSICPQGADKSSVRDLNYPSMAVKIDEPEKPFWVVFQRTVTNVGRANSTYRATISSNLNISITVVPDILSFKSLNEKRSFNVTVSGKNLDSPVFASLVWSDSTHSVRSPIVAYRN